MLTGLAPLAVPTARTAAGATMPFYAGLPGAKGVIAADARSRLRREGVTEGGVYR